MPIAMENYTNSKNVPWWTRHSKLVGFVTVTSLLMMATTLAVLYSYKSNIDSKQTMYVPSRSGRFARHAQEGGVCTTTSCVKAAEDIMHSLNEAIHPCDNFYQFACGGWIDKHTIPDDKSEVSMFSVVGDALNLQLKTLVEKPSDGSESKSIQMVKDMYASCIDLDNIEKLGSKPLQDILNTLGGWPVVLGNKWDDSKFDWMESTIAFRKHGYDYNILIGLAVATDFKNNKVNAINLDQAHLGMPDRSYLIKGLEDTGTKAYYNLMVQAAKKLGADEKTVEQELLQALNFEISLANISLPNEERRDFNKMYNKLTIPQLREIAPQINWLKYLNGLLNDPITESDTVILLATDYMKQIGDLITKTDKRVVANYMIWRVVQQSVSKLSKDWKKLGQELILAITGMTVEKPRWEQCVSMLSENLGIALSAYYIKDYFKGNSKQKALEMVGYIRNELIVTLKEVDWMAEDTRKQAIDKAEAITPYIGYPEQLTNDTLVDQLFHNLIINKDDYFDNYFNAIKWHIDFSFSKLRQPKTKGDWKDHADAAVVNAFYNPLENSIIFPAGILQKIFFDKDRPNYMNFGAIGYVIGHEITHGFDDMGKQFDKEGNNRNWWDKETDEHFTEKAKCIIDQYSNYTTETGLKVNGLNTQGENIADNGGLKQAYNAYHSWVKDHKPEGRLPGLGYTPSQLFWISAANVWCGKYRPEVLKLMIASDPHSPAAFRVIGPMSNSRDFAKAFSCPTGSKMNPEKKCRVW